MAQGNGYLLEVFSIGAENVPFPVVGIASHREEKQDCDHDGKGLHVGPPTRAYGHGNHVGQVDRQLDAVCNWVTF